MKLIIDPSDGDFISAIFSTAIVEVSTLSLSAEYLIDEVFRNALRADLTSEPLTPVYTNEIVFKLFL